jgi:hypothetical protein
MYGNLARSCNLRNQTANWLLLVKTIIALHLLGLTLARQNHRGIKIKLQNLNLGFNDGEVQSSWQLHATSLCSARCMLDYNRKKTFEIFNQTGLTFGGLKSSHHISLLNGLIPNDVSDTSP